MTKKYHILFLEDSPHDTELTKRHLRYTAHMIVTDNKEDYTAILERFHFDAIVADMKVPKIATYEALEIAKRLKPNIPFIYYTGSFDNEALKIAVELGAFACAHKDESPSKLIEIIKKAMGEVPGLDGPDESSGGKIVR